MAEHHYNAKLDIPSDADSARFFVPTGYTARLEDGVLIIEPKESEDERIRKDIISLVDEWWDRTGIAHPEFSTRGEMLAYLEKQKEQKLFPKFKVGDTIRCKYDDREFTIKSVDLEAGVYKYTKEGCGNDIDYADEDFELVEPKQEWSEEDENRLNNLCRIIKEAEGWNEVSKKAFINWLKSLKNRWNSTRGSANSPLEAQRGADAGT